MKSSRGFTFVELLVALAITAIIAGIFVKSFHTAIRSWQTGTREIQQVQDSQNDIPSLQNKLKTAKNLSFVSINSSDEAILVYEDENDRVISIYYNSPGNQALFSENNFPENSVIIHYDAAGASPLSEVLLDHIVSFNIVTYEESPRFFRLASANNLAEPVALDAISSLQFYAAKEFEGKRYVLQQLVDLIRTRIAFPGAITFGHVPNDASTFLFESTSTYQGFTAENMGFKADSDSTIADGAFLLTPNLKVTIRNSGSYFSTINDAIDVAVSGNDILVSAGEFQESIKLPSGVRLFGGYENRFWTRDLNNKTLIKVREGIQHTGVILQENCTIDGITIDGGGLIHGIAAENVSFFSISHCNITNTDTPIYIRKSSGIVKNNSVTGNVNGLVANDSHDINIYRNRFLSLNENREANILLQDSENIFLSNNLIVGGDVGVYAFGQSRQVNAVQVANNVVTGVVSFGVYSYQAIVTVLNNIIYGNDAGILIDPPAGSVVQYNIFGDHKLSHILGNFVADDTNIFDTGKNWNSGNAYLEDNINYRLKATSPAIDKGHPFASFNDKYADSTGSDPGLGTSRNDIGIYGGPKAGRLGPGQTTTLPKTSNTLSLASQKLWPGDHLRLSQGRYSASAVQLRDETWLTGFPRDSRIERSSSSVALVLGQGNVLESLVIEGLSGTGIQAEGKQNLELNSLELNGCSTGIELINSVADIRHLTFYNGGVGIKASQASTVAIDNSIFSSLSASAIDVSFSSVASRHCLFFENGSNSAGTVTFSDEITNTDPLFRNVVSGNLMLLPSSSAINASNLSDLGAYEFYNYSGQMTSPLLTTSLQTAYKSLVLTLFGDEGRFPSELTGINADIELAILSNGVISTLSPTVYITSSEKQTLRWNIPLRAISKQFQVRSRIISYEIGTTPYINDLKVTW